MVYQKQNKKKNVEGRDLGKTSLARTSKAEVGSEWIEC